MASTNKTTNYDLSQYIGTDKPTYLTDYNQDMSKIDTGIHAAKSEADQNATDIGTLSSLTTDSKTNLVAAINEVDGHADTNAGNIATNTSNIATNTTHIGTLANLTTASKTDLVVAANEINAKVGDLSSLDTPVKTSTVAAINSLKAMFDLTDIDAVTASVPSGYTIDGTPDIKVAKNSDGSIFKIYGNIVVTAAAWSSAFDITLTNTGLPAVDTAYTINNVCDVFATGTGGTPTFYSRPVEYQTNGDIKIKANGFGANSIQRISINPCLYFNTDFGD